MVLVQAKIVFARLCIYVGTALLIVQVVLKFRKPDGCAAKAPTLL